MTRRPALHPPYRKTEKGMALFVVLILLLVMTILGLASMRVTLLEERMAGNLYDRGLMFQAAEAALRHAEEEVSKLRPFDFTDACTNGMCGAPNPNDQDVFTERWADPSFTGWVNSTAVASGSISVTPQFFVELLEMGPNWVGCDQIEPVPVGCLGPRYRITARSSAAGRSTVLLQSNYTAPE